MRRYCTQIWRYALPVLILLLAGCALSPQTVRLKPALDVSQFAPQPPGRSIALSVSDARADKVVGYRGGVYATASITTDAGLAEAVRAEVARALGRLGYTVVGDGAKADIALGVEIAALGYSVTQEKVTRTIETTAVMRGRSVSGSVTRTGEYRDRRTKEVLQVPSESDNEALLNEVLSAALQRLVADPELLK